MLLLHAALPPPPPTIRRRSPAGLPRRLFRNFYIFFWLLFLLYLLITQTFIYIFLHIDIDDVFFRCFAYTLPRSDQNWSHTLGGGNNLIIFTCFLEGAAPPTVTHQRAHARAPRVRLHVICAAGFRRSSRGVEGALQIKLGA